MRATTTLRALAFCAGALSACSDPFFQPKAQPVEEEEVCAASLEWVSPDGTPPLDQFLPLPHPATECPFYRGGWQSFLHAMQPDAQGRAALLSYPTIGTVFQHAKAHPPTRAYLGDIKQAGGRQILIDQNGNSLYYGIHVNQAFADFIRDNGLQTAAALKAYPMDKPHLFFPAGVVEFKSAWQVVTGDAATVARETEKYISFTTTVPTLSQDPTTKLIIEDRDTPRTVTVRLLAIHVVFTLPGHPEFIWASFEHSMGTPDTQATDGMRDVAPIVPDDLNPTDDDPLNQNNTTVVSPMNHLLYRGGTAANAGNVAIDETELVLDPATQSFKRAGGGIAQTSIYRMFPASKSHTTHPDDAITSLNHNVEELFKQADPADRRRYYRLVGAQWMDKPAYFKLNTPLQNDRNSPFAEAPGGPSGVGVGLAAFTKAIQDEGADSPLSILAGEDRLSSTAMESFTQGPGSFNNCFTCHNTQAITAKGIPLNRDEGAGVVKLLDPGLLNVSHVLSQFLLEEYQDAQQP